MAASAAYSLAAETMARLGYDPADHGAGIMASVLFLVPGVPLIGGLFDFPQGQAVAAVSRLAHGVMILLAVALGLSLVIGLADVDASRQPPMPIAYRRALTLRAIARDVAGAAFAMLFNSPWRVAAASGLLALIANGMRLILGDIGFALAPSTCLAAFAVGLTGLAADRRLDLQALVTTVAPVVIMMPGVPPSTPSSSQVAARGSRPSRPSLRAASWSAHWPWASLRRWCSTAARRRPCRAASPLAGDSKSRPSHRNGEDRAGRLAHDLLRRGAEEPIGEALPATGRHHHEIRAG